MAPLRLTNALADGIFRARVVVQLREVDDHHVAKTSETIECCKFRRTILTDPTLYDTQATYYREGHTS